MLGQVWSGSNYAQRFEDFLRSAASRMGLALDPAQDVIIAFQAAIETTQELNRSRMVEERAREAERRIAPSQELIAGEVARFMAQVGNYQNQARARLGEKVAELQAAMQRGYPPESARRDYAQYLDAIQKGYAADVERARAQALARLQGI